MTRGARRIRVAAIASVFGAIVTASGPASALNRWVELINDSDHDLVEFFASNVDSPEWGHDRLGSRILWSGDSIRRNIDDGSGHCHFDFRAVFDDGEVLERHDVDVCRISEFTYY